MAADTGTAAAEAAAETLKQIFAQQMTLLDESLGISNSLRVRLHSSQQSLQKAQTEVERLQSRLGLAKTAIEQSQGLWRQQQERSQRLQEQLTISKTDLSASRNSLAKAQSSLKAERARHRREVVVAGLVGAGIGAGVTLLLAVLGVIG